MIDTEEIDAATRKRAEERAREGADLAYNPALDAEPRTSSQEGTRAEVILVEAEALGASVILIGSRGLSRAGVAGAR